MSYCKQEGKDRVIFVTEADQETAAKVSLPEDDDDEPVGLIQPDGEINWSCPCLGGMATGPCGVEFREAFTCFHYSSEEPKGSDCLESFRQMSECMAQYPNVYGNKDKDEKESEGMPTESASATSKDMPSESSSENVKDVPAESTESPSENLKDLPADSTSETPKSEVVSKE